jgi:hypothetical protein
MVRSAPVIVAELLKINWCSSDRARDFGGYELSTMDPVKVMMALPRFFLRLCCHGFFASPERRFTFQTFCLLPSSRFTGLLPPRHFAPVMIHDPSHRAISGTCPENAAALTVQMHQTGLPHGDPHARNLLVLNEESVKIIDLDSMDRALLLAEGNR